jgi:hypothetical protein
MLPKYIIFAGSIYYPSGGLKEFYSYAETLEEAYSIYGEALQNGCENYRSFGVDIKSSRPSESVCVQIVCAYTNVIIKDSVEDTYVL